MIVAIVCVGLILGVPLGTALFGLLTDDPSLILATDIAGVPVLVYALISTGPFAVVAGLLGSRLIVPLAGVSRLQRSGLAWVVACAAFGLVAGATVVAAPLLLGGASNVVWAVLVSGALAGGVCGTVLGLLSQRQRHHLNSSSTA